LALHLACVVHQKYDQAVGSGLSLATSARSKHGFEFFQLFGIGAYDLG
jgi:hypothetical protein